MKRVKEVQKELAESDRMCPPGRDWEFLSESGKLNMTIKKEWLNWFLINTPSKEKIMNIIKTDQSLLDYGDMRITSERFERLPESKQKEFLMTGNQLRTKINWLRWILE